MAITVRFEGNLTVQDYLDTTVPGISSSPPPQLFDSFNKSQTMTASSTPAASKHVELNQALSTGAATIDLTSMTGWRGAVDFTGLKVNGMLLTAPATNTAPVVLTKGASNGYGLSSAHATWTCPVPPGATVVFYFPANLAAVSGSHKNIDLSGSGSETVNITLVAG